QQRRTQLPKTKPHHIFFTRPTSTSRNTAIMMNLVLALLLQLSMFMLAEAAPMTVQSAKPWQAGTGGGIIGFIVLVLDIIAWIEIFKSNRPVPNKVLWALVVFLFPVVGMIIYYLFSNRQAHNTYEPIPA
ncbi:hypothetical protein GT037_002287, partial [Alternaria burnsii]